ncbi:signal recognition particle subunit FFH/SRP54 (srp54) [Caldanaerobius fijiensis DSM 17918]|uniref:Signal recognition particle protein n=1 Tax=Caldanaerobius fijiensis DSM 17918 TaxID=1121256 RepID=A0A1M5E706_9THEO|nr:signal recognition particle protein [Caldanaerobius fijiensis]SHF74970.1 signal recognition particle subunit FFH/SRP54 (srp54) [Caldanaerobius fijiensis DSM 17918]
MAFENLANKLQNVFKKLRGKGKLTEKDIKDAMREVRLALLEADVNFKVVKDFIDRVSEKCIGAEVLESLTPAQHVIKIVRDELTELMGSTQSKLNLSAGSPFILMMVGLQGSGKTTTAAKIGGYLKKQGKHPLLVACDIYRPAAIKQLQVVGDKLGIPVFSMGQNISPVDIAKASIGAAKKGGNDVIIIDTAGRLHIDEEMMQELKDIKSEVRPHEILLVVDAMTGQDAVNIAKNFNEQLGIDGIVMTKLDGDTRGGAALSVKAVTGKPIKFAGIGEKLEDIEPFYPDRMASRILGMGDVLTLIEKAEQAFDEKKAMELQEKISKHQFTLQDFLDQMQEVKKMGPLNQLLEMIPGLNQKQLKGFNVDEKEITKIEAIIKSMTPEERANPSIINSSRKKRIAMGSGTSIQDVNKLLREFEQTRKMMKQFQDIDKDLKKGKKKFPLFGRF